MKNLKSYIVWDANIRWFHWINVLCIISLIAIGVAMLNGKALGLSTEGKILLKTIHVWIGYIFVLNLSWRIIWAFIGDEHARWQAILPFGKGYIKEMRDYIYGLTHNQPVEYSGHTPPGRLAVTTLFFLLLIQAITGLVLAGTDLYYPPIGSWVANWIAAPGIDPATLIPYAREMYDEESYKAMRDFRKPFISIHYYAFYALISLIVMHILAVVVTEIHGGSNLISAMFSGKKTLSKPPVDKKQND